MQQVSVTRSNKSGRSFEKGPLTLKSVTDSAVQELAKIGIWFDHATVADQVQQLNKAGAFKKSAGMDSAFVAPATQGSVPTPLQFLQTWLPGFVKVLTAARKIDDILGIKTVGSWEDQEIVQSIVEPAATAMEYGDYTNIPLASWNVNFERRTIVRGEMGMAVGLLEEGRSAAMRLSSAETKRQAAAVSLEILRNAIGFFGWNNGNNRTFGLLNDPQMLPVITSATAGSGGWVGATFGQITADLRNLIITLRVQSQDQIDPKKVKMTLVLPMEKVDLLTVTTDFGISVYDWLDQTYPNIRVVSCPEFSGGDPDGSGEDICYLFAEDIDSSIDGASDGGEVIAQLVQTKFMTLGVEKRAKSYVEDYSNAMAGVMCKRPWALVRMIGL